jgi:HD superfamily phosphodiesterase
MATQSKASKSETKTKAKTTTKAASAEKNTAQAIAERAVDLPVGAVLTAADRVVELVEPFNGRSAVEKQLKTYRTEARRQVKRTERRGTTARRQATTEARKTRKRVERAARKRQRTVETTLKRNRDEIEQRVRKAVDLLPV